jgi:predicted amidophosphoribosyltransferase
MNNFVFFSYIKKYIALFIQTIQYFLFPSFCASCKTYAIEQKNILCNTCTSQITPLVSQSLEITKTKNMNVYSVGAYENPLKKMILAKGHSDIAISCQLGIIATHTIDQLLIEFDYVIPIPLHWTRYAKRGYNQAFEIASIIASQSKKPVIEVL